MPGVGIALRGFGKAFKNVEKKADKISEKMRAPGSKGAPTAKALKESQA